MRLARSVALLPNRARVVAGRLLSRLVASKLRALGGAPVPAVVRMVRLLAAGSICAAPPFELVLVAGFQGVAPPGLPDASVA